MTLNPKHAIEPAANYDARSAAKRLNLAEQTLANWRHLRKGPPYVKIGRKIIYREVDLAAFELKNRIDPEDGLSGEIN